MSQEKNFKLLRNIVQLCEYMYRKGVLDAAICGDAFEINECTERDDTFETFRFLRDEEGDEARARRHPQGHHHHLRFIAPCIH